MPSVSVEELDQLKQMPDVTEEEFESGESVEDKLEEAKNMLKRTAVLLMYLADPNWCRNLTKRERGIMDKHVDAIYALTDEIDETLEDAADEDD